MIDCCFSKCSVATVCICLSKSCNIKNFKFIKKTISKWFRNPYCQSCFDDHFTYCAFCESVIQREDALYYDGDSDPYCEQCYDGDDADDSTIHDYNYKPTPIFYGDGLYLGVELEIDRGGYDAGNADDILYTANRQQEHLYAKYDGSIDDGFELVSHPMTLDYHLHQMPWMEVMKRAVSLGYRSHSTTTCGLHVHCDRNAFGKTYEEQEVVVARILFFIEKHWDELLKFSRRTEYQINRWASRYGFKDTPTAVMKNAKDRNLGRYVCVNLENAYTIEFRLFRGTLRYQTFCATLQLVDEICQKAISLTDKQFQRLTWGQFVSDIPKEKAELIAYTDAVNPGYEPKFILYSDNRFQFDGTVGEGRRTVKGTCLPMQGEHVYRVCLIDEEYVEQFNAESFYIYPDSETSMRSFTFQAWGEGPFGFTQDGDVFVKE